MRVNLERKSRSEQQLARARVTPPFVLSGQSSRPSRQLLQPPQQLAVVLQRLHDPGGELPHPLCTAVRADPTQRAAPQQRPPMLHQATQQLRIGLTQDPIRPITPRPTQAYQT